MADRYWVGGTGNWDASTTTNWSATSGGAGGASVPTSADNVFFNGSSGTGTVTVTATANCSNLDFTGYTGTFAGSSNVNTYGTVVTFATGMTQSWTGVLYFNGATISALTTNGKTISTLSILAGSGGVSLQDTLNVSGTISINAGTFTTNNNTVNCGTISTSSTNTINFGSSTINLSDTTSPMNMGASTTVNAGTSTIVITDTSTSSKTFAGSGKTYYNLTFASNTPSGRLIISGTNTFNNVTINGPSSDGVVEFACSNNQTINGTLTLSGSNGNRRILVRSSTLGTTRTLTAATVSITDADFRDITAAGTASPFTGTRIGDAGGNTNVTTTTPKTVYWSLLAGGNFTSTAFATSSGGTPALTNFPLPQDTLIIDNTGLTTGNTISITALYSYPTITVTRTNAFTLNINAAMNLYGSLTLTSATTMGGASGVFCYGRGTTTITSNGASFSSNALNIDAITGTVQLADAFLNASSVTLLSGTFNLSNQNLSCSTFNSSNSNTRTLTLGSGTVTVSGTTTAWNLITTTGLTFNANTSTIVVSNTTASQSLTFAGGGLTYNNVVLGAGGGTSQTYTISGSNTFSSLSSNKSVAYTFRLTAGTTQTVTTFGITGSSGNIVTVGSTTTSAATIAKAGGGTAFFNYASISYITGSPVSTWYASNSTDGGNNTNINFTVPATRYWVGSTASWDGTAGTKWALTSGGGGGAPVPTTAEDVYFDASSGSGTVTIAAGNTGAKSITCTGFTGTLTGTDAITVAGSITLVAGMTYNHIGTVTISATGTLTTAGKTFSAIDLNASGGTLTLGDSLNTANRTIQITAGTFTTNNNTVSTGGLNSSNSNVRTINLGSSTVTITLSAAISFTTSTNLTLNAGTSSITLSNSSATLDAGSGFTFYNVTFSAGTGNCLISGANTFNNLIFNPPASAGIRRLALNANQTVNGTFTVSGSSGNIRAFVRSNSTGTAITITAAAVSLTDVDFSDITAAGAASPFTGTRLGDAVGNTNITFPATKTVYWSLLAGGNFTANAFATSSGGTPATTNFPLAQDTLIIDDAGLTTGNTITVTTGYNYGTITVTRTNGFTFAITSALLIYGDLTLTSVTTRTGTVGIGFQGRKTQTVTSAGVSFANPITVATGTTLSLADAFVTTDLLTNDGTLTTNNNNITSGVVSAGTSTFNLGSSTFTCTGTSFSVSAATTVNAGTSTIILSDTSATAKTFAGAGKTYYNLVLGAGAGTCTYTISGSNTFNSLSSNKSVAYTVSLTSGTTQTVTTWGVNGSAGNVLTLQRSSTTNATLAKAGGGTATIDYATVTGITGSPASTWYATNSTNGGNNVNITFGAPPVGGGGNFIMFFIG